MTRCLGLLLLAGLLLACRPVDSDSTPTPTSTSTSNAFRTTIPTPTPTPDADGGFYPLGTRTGVASVDAVLNVVEARDAQALTSLIHYYPVACTPPGSLGDVACPNGQPAGSGVEVIGASRCGGGYLPRDSAEARQIAAAFLATADNGIEFDPRLFGVLRRPLLGGAPQIPGNYLLIFASGGALYVDGGGVTYFLFSCRPPQVAQEVLEVAELIPGPKDYLLHPR